MIQFASPWHGPRPQYFEARCPVCELTEVRLRYVSYPEDTACNTQAYVEEPEIVEQACFCLLGQDWAKDALSDHLGDLWDRDPRWEDPRL